MTTIILFEGIPTSGKTYLIEKITARLESEKKSVLRIADEEVKTPFARKSDHKDPTPAKDAPEYLKELLQSKLSKKPDYLLCDNFHLFYLTTNSMKGAKESLKNYEEIETMLEVYPTLLVFLEIEQRYILPSFRKRIARNELLKKVDPLIEFLKQKGTEFNQIAYYQKKQQLYLDAVKKTKVHYLHITINQRPEYNDFAGRIIKKTKEIEGGWKLRA